MADRLLYYVIFVVFVIVTCSQPSLGALYDQCSSDANCADVNGVCREELNSIMNCICNETTHYNYEGICFEKIPTGDVCNSSTPCLDLLATCQNVSTSGIQDFRCSCNSGYSDTGGVCASDTAVTPGTATLISGTTSYDSTATVKCNTGYTPVTSMITCQSNGQCSKAVCSVLNCGNPNPTSVSGGTASYSSTTYNSTASVSCSSGYENPSPRTITCEASGDWSSASCSKKDCGSSINTITNGRASPSGSTTYESTAPVTCDTGYKDPSPRVVTCQSDGTWSSFSCVIQDCGSSINTITNGRASPSGSTTYESTAPVTCDTGYKDPSPRVVTCQSDGTWSSFSCVIQDCGSSINTITNGRASPSGSTTYESTAPVTCDTGYKDPSPQVVTCQSDGTWSSFSCVIQDCGSSINTITNGRASPSGSTTYESTAPVTCDTGYTDPSPQAVTCQSDGTWSSSSCAIQDCGSSINTITNGIASSSGSTTYESTAPVTCDTGYKDPSPQVVTCQSDGTWSSFSCVIQDCGSSINTITNGRASPSGSTTYESTAPVTCDTGFKDPSPQVVTCQSDGTWSSFSCVIQDCGSSINTITNGRASPSGSTTYESTAPVTCDTGYKDPSPQVVTCQSDGTWSSSSCAIQDCGSSINTITNGRASPSGSTTYESTASVTCDTGYKDPTPQVITCQSDGTWSSFSCAIQADFLGTVCPNPTSTNLSPTDLCVGVDAFCLRRSSTSNDYTCQCSTEYYDNNGDDAGGSCSPISDLQARSITFASISTTSMTVSWLSPSNKQSFVNSYIVEWSDKGNSIQGGSSSVLGQTTYSISNNLTSGRFYTVKVITRNSVDYTSTMKTTFVVEEQAIKPQTPGAVNAGSSDLDAVDKNIWVVWTGSVGDVGEYEWKLWDGNREVKSGTTASSSAYINYNEIKNGYRYTIYITALSQTFDNGKTIRSETRTEEIKTVVKVPSAPLLVECHMTTDTSITIKWGASLHPNGDLIDYKIDTYELGSNIVLKTNRTGSLELMYEITGLQPGAYYYFDVSTVNEKFTSPPARLSPSYCATRANVSDMPNNLIVSEVQSRSLMVSWTKPTNTYRENMGYVVQVRTADSACVMELIRNCSDCTQSLNDSALENMCPNEKSSSEQLSKASIESDDKQMYIVTGLNPYVNYTITVTAVNAAGRGKVAEVIVQTDEEVPQKPEQVVILDVTSKSCNVTWNIDGPRPGDTLWDVIVDAASPVLNRSIPLKGFSQRRQAINDLQEYWNYTVTIKATTSKGSSFSDPMLFTTSQAAPGPVDGFDVKTSPGGSTVQVQWKIPRLLERNSEIARFSLYHNTSSDGNIQEMSLERNADNDEYLYDVKLNVTPEVVYQFKVYAINVGGEAGEQEEITVEAPAGIPFNSFETIDNKTVILPEDIIPSPTTLKLSIDNGFYEQTSRGSVILTGLIGCAKDKCSENEVGVSMTVDEFNTLDNWHNASAGGFTKYRITRADWRDELSQNRRKRQANNNTEEFIVGAEMCDDLKKTQYCNGPLQPSTSYIIHVVICTSGGCLLSNEYGPFTTLAGQSDDDGNSSYVIIIAVIASIVAVAIIITVVIIINLRRRRTTGKRQTAKIPQSQESHDEEAIEKHHNVFEFTEVTEKMTSIEVMAWMNANDFIEYQQNFRKYTGKDLLGLSKDDVKSICGAADGIRLFNRMRQRPMNNEGPLRVYEGDLNTHYADLDETTRDGVPYENIELNEAHMYSSLNYEA